MTIHLSIILWLPAAATVLALLVPSMLSMLFLAPRKPLPRPLRAEPE